MDHLSVACALMSGWTAHSMFIRAIDRSIWQQLSWCYLADYLLAQINILRKFSKCKEFHGV